MSTNLVFKSDYKNPSALIEEFFAKHDYISQQEKENVLKAWNFLTEKCAQNPSEEETPHYIHPLRVADILAENKLDSDTIISAILHPIMEFGVTPEDLKNGFGETVYNMVKTVHTILNMPINAKTLHQSDAIRNMLFVLSDDARVILLAIADRLDRVRNIKSFTPEQQKVIADAGINIWAPLADRLGMQAEKNEFEDLSLKYTNPAVFQQIKAIVSQKKDERSVYLEKAVQAIYKSAEKMHLKVEVHSRAKHFYSIYQKMRKRNKEAGELYDLLALRILCETPAECYTIIGIVHGLWTPLDGRFKDYIAMPKANGYQSLHTTVMCEGKPLEIQIRTHQMHNMAEHGIASHWLYKKGSSRDLIESEKLDIYNRMQKLKEMLVTDGSTFTTLKQELIGDEIYVFTPKGDVKKLPAGATAVDFAYSIHSAIGEKIIAAKADGKIIPISKPLQNTQIIEVITNPQAHPTEAQLSYAKTSKAHQKIHSWLMANDPTFSEALALKAEAEKSDEAPKNDAGENQNLLHQRKQKQRPKKGTQKNPELPKPNRRVLVQGEPNVLYNLSQCCHPHYPDLICGYVTRSKGVSIHRADCLIYQRIPEKDKRSVEVQWDEKE